MPLLKSQPHPLVNVITTIKPIDQMEAEHIHDTISWIESGAPIYRVQKPDIPPKHLVSYFVLWDEEASKILLVDHKKAQLWLPPGGHVDPGEDPREAARRECFEELGIEADFIIDDPLFLTQTVTAGLTPGHTDVSLWYLLRGSATHHYAFDEGEFEAIKWFSFDEIPFEKSDPHMGRFIAKLKGIQ